MRVNRVVPLLLVALAVAAPLAAAEPADVNARVLLPLRAAGSAETVAPEPALLIQGTAGTATWRLEAPEATLVEVEYWEQVTQAPGLRAHSGIRTTEHALDKITVTLHTRLDGFTALAWSDREASGSVHGGPAAALAAADPAWTVRPDLRVFRLVAPAEVSAPVADDDAPTALVLGKPAPFVHTIDAGSMQMQTRAALHRLGGTVEGYLHGAEIRVAHDGGLLPLALTERIETRPGSVYVPGSGWTGPGEHDERIVSYVQFAAADARLVADTAGAVTALFSPALDVRLDGHLAMSAADGVLALASGRVPLDAEPLVLSGIVQAHVAPDASAERAHLTGSGDVTYVRVGTDAQAFPVAKAAAAAAGLAILAGLAVAVWHVAPGLLPLFSRVAKEDVLDHKTRADIYDLVKADPGVTPHDIVTATGVGWSTVMYHLTVLERNELVIPLKDGRYRRYFDRTSGKFANGRKDLVAAMKNETTAKIARHIRDHPGLAQRRIAETFGLAASSVHWHVTRLVNAGLVEKRRAAQSVGLMPGPAWDKLEEAVPQRARDA